MQALSVLMVGCTQQEKSQIKAILKRTCDSYTTRFCDLSVWLRGDAPVKEPDLVLVRWRQDADRHLLNLADSGLPARRAPIFALSDGFDPDLVINLENLGIERVIPVDHIDEYLPSCLGVFSEETARHSRCVHSLAGEKERGARASEDRFSRIFETSPIAMCILSYQDGRTLDVNDSLARLLDTTKEDLTGKKLLEETLAQDFAKFRDELDHSLFQDHPLVLQRRLLTRQRKSIHVSLTADLVDWGGEKVVFILLLDIRDRVQAEETIRRVNEDLERRVLERTASYETVNRALQQEIGFRKAIEQTSDRLMQIVWQTPDIVAMCDLNGRLLFLNRTGRRILGLDDQSPVWGLSVYDFYAEEFKPYILEKITAVVNEVGYWYGEAELHIYNKEIPISQVILAHKDPEGVVQYYSTIARDISEQKRAAAELQRAYEREKELGTLRSHFFSMTSHQFRTPLSTILSSAELIEHYGSQWPEEKRNVHLRRIEDAVQRLNQMLNDILTVGSIETNTQNVSIHPVDLAKLCDRMVKDAASADQWQHAIETSYNLSGRLLHTDESILEKVLDNLLSNALKFSPAGGAVRVFCDFSDSHAVIRIIDRGIGIPEDETPLIFEPFHRGKNVVDTPGSGLGLMIVQKSLKLIQGEIEIDSNVNSGTLVTVHIPDLLNESPANTPSFST